jgi:hypothetical protein
MSVVHYAACAGWSTGDLDDCNCYEPRAWRVRKEPAEQFPWRIWRRTNDGAYEHVMRCSTWAGAMSLIEGFTMLRREAALCEMTERSAMWANYRPKLGDHDV